jgi:hypothetical protein
MKVRQILEFAKKQGYVNAELLEMWNGYEVYAPLASDDGPRYLGPPLVIFVQNNEIRISTVEEAFEYMHDWQRRNDLELVTA